MPSPPAAASWVSASRWASASTTSAPWACARCTCSPARISSSVTASHHVVCAWQQPPGASRAYEIGGVEEQARPAALPDAISGPACCPVLSSMFSTSPTWGMRCTQARPAYVPASASSSCAQRLTGLAPRCRGGRCARHEGAASGVGHDQTAARSAPCRPAPPSHVRQPQFTAPARARWRSRAPRSNLTTGDAVLDLPAQLRPHRNAQRTVNAETKPGQDVWSVVRMEASER